MVKLFGKCCKLNQIWKEVESLKMMDKVIQTKGWHLFKEKQFIWGYRGFGLCECEEQGTEGAAMKE